MISGGISFARSFGSTTGFVFLEYTEPPAAPVNSFVALSPAATSAVLGGASFVVDMMFDKSTMIATGSVDIVGFGFTAAPPLDVSAVAGITSSTPVAATNLFLGESFGFDADVRMEEISVFIPVTLIGDLVLIRRDSATGGTFNFDLVAIDSIALTTDLPVLTDANVLIAGNNVSVNLSGLTVDPGQFFTVELNPTATTPSVPALSDLGVLMLVGMHLVSARHWVTSAEPVGFSLQERVGHDYKEPSR